jgi:predicted Zn finger-like uncharacterized protein
MLTQCPSCRARVTLSDGHAGSKVRCSECGRVYLARPEGAPGPLRPRGGTRLLLGLGATAVLILAAFLALREPGPVAAREPAAAPQVTEQEPHSSQDAKDSPPGSLERQEREK